MIHSKNNMNGFTLLEVLFAIAILGSILTPLILNQTRILGRIGLQSELLVRTFAGERFMIDSYITFEQDNRQRKATKLIDNPQTTITFSIIDLPATIKKEFRDMYKQEVVIEWEEDGKKLRSNLLTFLFFPKLEAQ